MKGDRGLSKIINIKASERELSILTHSLFSAWMLSFLFEGQILYYLADSHKFEPKFMIFSGAAAIFTGLLLFGLFIKTKKAAKKLFLFSYSFFIVISGVFFFPPSPLWIIGIIVASFLAGGCVAGWAFYLKDGTPKNQRIKTIADMLILSNLLMILNNMTAIHISPYVGLLLSTIMLLAALLLALKLPEEDSNSSLAVVELKGEPIDTTNLLVFLYLFITIITINSGLMYQVVNPAFPDIEWLTSWYWAIPYITAVFVMKNLPQKTNRSYILYVAIAMIGLSFIGFMGLKPGVLSYLILNTLMMGACGVYDLFWWSILGEMLELHHNPAKILGIGLSANILGILLGGILGGSIISSTTYSLNPTLLALTVVCVTLVLLPPLHKHLSLLLKDHAYLVGFAQLDEDEQINQIEGTAKFGKLSERESQVAFLLLQGKTYRVIAKELLISENTVKYYVKNIYYKFGINSRGELIDIMQK
ncbi:MAG: helix-turn-helix transcriptional regulator [Tissierellaceae bacterium]